MAFHQGALARPNPKVKVNLFRRHSPGGGGPPLCSAEQPLPGAPPTRGGRPREPGGPSPLGAMLDYRGLRSPRSPPTSTSKKTRGLPGLEGLVLGDGCDILTCRRVWKRIPGASWLQRLPTQERRRGVHGDLEAALTSHFRRQVRKRQLDFRHSPRPFPPAALPRAGIGVGS